MGHDWDVGKGTKGPGSWDDRGSSRTTSNSPGYTTPSANLLQQALVVRKQKVDDALKRLCRHNEDYRHGTINAQDGLMSILSKGLLGRVFSSDLEDAGSSGYGVQDVNSSLVRGNLPLTSRIILDVNRVSDNREAELLSESAYFRRAVQQRSYGDKVVNVIRGSNLLSDYYEFFFLAAFPTLFPYGTDKHIHSLRQHPLNLKAWTYLLLRPSSTYIIEDKVLLKWYRRCQGHAHFVGLVFDFLRRRKSSTFLIKPNARPGIKQKISSKRSQLATLKMPPHCLVIKIGLITQEFEPC